MPSEIDARTQAEGDLPDAAIRAELERILASEVFSRSQQLRRFLAFIVEQRLAGQGHSLKESVLAHELYGKGTDFDGGIDPVVRVDARRLRDKLREYYEGRSEPVLISLPKGSYIPVFEANSSSPPHPLTRLIPLSRPGCADAAGEPLLVPHLGAQELPSALWRRRVRGRRRACLALTPQSRERSNPAAPARLVPRWRRAAGVVARRQPRRVRLVGPGRDWSDGYLCKSRRE